jgi:hypothetical protein
MKLNLMLIIGTLLTVLTSCSPSADKILQEAENLIETGNYWAAREKINIVIDDYGEDDIYRAENLMEKLDEAEAYDGALFGKHF